MLDYILIFIGCGIGGLLRHLVSSGAYAIIGRNLPYGTLLVNVTGSFLMGLIAIVMLRRCSSAITPQITAFFLIGLLGGYTTFSSFSMDTITLFEQGAPLKALANIGLSVILCLLATWIGAALGKQL